jgi:hypothetical protein
MAYTVENFKTKKALKEAFARGERIEIYQPGGIFPLNPRTGTQFLEGPHYPKPHTWYAQVEVEDAIITRIVR